MSVTKLVVLAFVLYRAASEIEEVPGLAMMDQLKEETTLAPEPVVSAAKYTRIPIGTIRNPVEIGRVPAGGVLKYSKGLIASILIRTTCAVAAKNGTVHNARTSKTTHIEATRFIVSCPFFK